MAHKIKRRPCPSRPTNSWGLISVIEYKELNFILDLSPIRRCPLSSFMKVRDNCNMCSLCHSTLVHVTYYRTSLVQRSHVQHFSAKRFIVIAFKSVSVGEGLFFLLVMCVCVCVCVWSSLCASVSQNDWSLFLLCVPVCVPVNALVYPIMSGHSSCCVCMWSRLYACESHSDGSFSLLCCV
jgi:hypothetical protein